MLYQHIVEDCFADRVGAAGLEHSDYEKLIVRTAALLTGLRQARDSDELPILNIAARRDDLERLESVAESYRRRFSDVILLGTGGSSLGGQAIYALADRGFGPPRGRPALHFMDNVDPDSFAALMESIDPTRSGVVAISKSGSTAETMMQLFTLLPWLERASGRDGLGDQITVITEPLKTADAQPNPLRQVAQRYGLPVLEHDPGIGGRFAALTNVGLLPAALAGLDPVGLREGAGRVLDETLGATAGAPSPPMVGAALAVGLAERCGLRTSVMMPYLDRLETFAAWYQQLWAESLGKNGKGTTPIRALGTVDQHSQLQLYLDGPRDKLFTLMMIPTRGEGARIDGSEIADERLDYLAGRTMGDLLEAEARATARSLIGKGCPTRLMMLPKLDEQVLGGLMMHFMLETILAAGLLGVDAFDQPAVEEGKVLARQDLRQQTAEERDGAGAAVS